MDSLIGDIYPAKAQFGRNEPVEIIVEMRNPLQAGKVFELEAKTVFLNRVEETYRQKFQLQPGMSVVLSLPIGPRDVDFGGYGVDVALHENGKVIEEVSTSFDVATDWRVAPRYGFLSDFYPMDRGDSADVQDLRKYHVNLVQFYDWMYRHDHLIPPQDEFEDLMGRKLDFGAVREKIALCRSLGMKTMAYGAVYAASKAFYEEHPDWALYNSFGEPLDFINIFRIMDISGDSPWRGHIIGQYREAIRAGFDGIHMDTYGFPKTAIAKRGEGEKVVRLDEEFPSLIDDSRVELSQEKQDVCLIFNNVGNWPVEATAPAAQDAVYVEVWPPFERYEHLQNIIRQARAAGRSKPVILAAYVKSFDGADVARLPAAQHSALFLMAATAANGAYNILFGEENGILMLPYYVNYFRMDEQFAQRARAYCDFIVRYSNVLFDGKLKDVSMTHMLGDNREYLFEGFEPSAYAESGKVWTIVRESPAIKCVSLINLCGNGDLWNEGKNKPILQSGLKLKVLVENPREPFSQLRRTITMGDRKISSFQLLQATEEPILILPLRICLYGIY